MPDLLGGRRWAIIQGDLMEVLRGMPDNSVHCAITSPPYWGLRDYGIPPTIWDGVEGCEHEWGEAIVAKGTSRWDHFVKDGNVLVKSDYSESKAKTQGTFCRLCGAWRGSLGLEPTIELYVRHLVTVFREIRRVLRIDGTCWLNIGDSYAGGNCRGGGIETASAKQRSNTGTLPFMASNPTISPGLKPKDLCLIPARVALALQADGWWVRSRIIWAKGVSFCKTYSGSCMPESVRDRPSTSYEDVYLLTKSARYFYDQDAVREATQTGLIRADDCSEWKHAQDLIHGYSKHLFRNNPAGRNLRSVWLINPRGFPGAHFATFPPALVEPMIKAGTSEKGVCPECDAPWRRVVEKASGGTIGQSWHPHDDDAGKGNAKVGSSKGYQAGRTLGWQPTCECNVQHHWERVPNLPSWKCSQCGHVAADPTRCGKEKPPPGRCIVPGLVLDPFSGSGTTIMVALRLGRRGIGIDISEDYCAMARKRIIEDCPMWNTP